jgi:hypothetical protein
MRYFNEKCEIISMDSIDLTKGTLVSFQAIKEDATPIDNITKFAWDDSDYEEAQMYMLFSEEDIKPTQLDEIQAQVAYTAMMTETLIY